MALLFIRQSYYSRLISSCLMVSFISTVVITPKVQANVAGLPQPGTMVDLSSAYTPIMITGLTVHPENPLLMDFIVSTGNSGLNASQVKEQSGRLIKYFLASLTIPENNQWVNLSPYENQRIIPEDLGKTVLGQDMLAQDYILKQLTASLIYPEKSLGKNFWDTLYAKAREIYGTTQIPVNTFNKVWILPQYAKVYAHNNTVFVVKSHLKVMLDEDYLALSKKAPQGNNLNASPATNTLGSQIIRQIILPAIEKEVNTGKNFAPMRQIYNSMILAVWFKNNLKQALLNQVYTNKSKINGVNLDDPAIKEKLYQQYLHAYKKGVFNYIKEDVNQNTQEVILRKYFSGGLTPVNAARITTSTLGEAANFLSNMQGENFKVTALTQRAGPVVKSQLTENEVVGIVEKYMHEKMDIKYQFNVRAEFKGDGFVVTVARKNENKSGVAVASLAGRLVVYLHDLVIQNFPGMEFVRIDTGNGSIFKFRIFDTSDEDIVRSFLDGMRIKTDYSLKFKYRENGVIVTIYQRDQHSILPLDMVAIGSNLQNLSLPKDKQLVQIERNNPYVVEFMIIDAAMTTAAGIHAGEMDDKNSESMKRYSNKEMLRIIQYIKDHLKKNINDGSGLFLYPNSKNVGDFKIFVKAIIVIENVLQGWKLESNYGRLDLKQMVFLEAWLNSHEEDFLAKVRKVNTKGRWVGIKLATVMIPPLFVYEYLNLTDAIPNNTTFTFVVAGIALATALAVFSSDIRGLVRKVNSRSDAAQVSSPGGIDLASSHMHMESTGEKVNIIFDPAMINQFKRGDFSGVKIQIIDVVPVILLPLLGLKDQN